jgi:hypothetical protein
VFSGRDVIIWGGRSDASTNITPGSAGTPSYALGDGAAYDVRADSWRVLPGAPISARFDAVAVWTGHEMLVVGGRRDHARPQGGIAFLRDGAAYDPATRRWRRIPDAPTCPAIGTWTGTRLVVGGTCADIGGSRPAFAEFDPVRNRWSSLPVVASATQLVAAGGHLYAWSAATGRGAIYEPGPRRWRSLPGLPEEGPQDTLAVAYEHRLAVVARMTVAQHPDSGGSFVFDPTARSWTGAASAVGPPLLGSVASAAPGAVLWSSADSLAAETIDRAMRSFSLISVGDAPIRLDRLGESIVGVGYRRFLVWGGRLGGTASDPTNRPTADGAIVQVRPLQP